ncbi:MAG: hypothetical protein KDI71_01745 [Xanthomonadales bacterium]|nr:hypothetical protein [Xanthomonadales bacterium]
MIRGCLGLLLGISVALAAPAGDFELPSYTSDSGGGYSSGGVYAVQGTIAQVDADPLHPASGGPWEVVGGFWPTVAERPDDLFADGFED